MLNLQALEASVTPHERIVLTEHPEWSVSATVLWEIAKLNHLVAFAMASIMNLSRSIGPSACLLHGPPSVA
jgi:hypothetical protein